MPQHPVTMPQSASGREPGAPAQQQPALDGRKWALLPIRLAPPRSRVPLPAPFDSILRAILSPLVLASLAALLALPIAQRAHAFVDNPGTEGDGPSRIELRHEGAAAPSGQGGIIDYTVQQGDTLYGLAAKYGISVESLIWANDLESSPDMLSLGEALLIPPVDGVVHIVKPGDTLSSIAGAYKAAAGGIRDFAGNHLEGESPALQAGQRLMVPGGVKPKPAPKPVPLPPPAPAAPAENAQSQGSAEAATNHLIWPISGTISQHFMPYHRAIDILGAPGQPIAASDNGTVTFAGWSDSGYGYYVVIDHGNNLRTLYAHMSRIDVQAGQAVKQGDTIGAVGDTGRATAFHCHFEVYDGGVQRNPLDYLK